MEEGPGLIEIRATAEKLKAKKYIEYDFKKIEKDWKEAKNLGTPLPSEYYFDKLYSDRHWIWRGR